MPAFTDLTAEQLRDILIKDDTMRNYLEGRAEPFVINGAVMTYLHMRK